MTPTTVAGLISSGERLMGIPQNYSLDLPNRCIDLLDGLWDQVASDKTLGMRHGGPLSTTFLLTLATPIITLPTERILKQDPRIEGTVDDWHVDADLAERLRLDFAADMPFSSCSFFDASDGWSYASHGQLHNFARCVPEDIETKLGTHEAREAAKALPAVRAILSLRNSLAHGSIAYLDDAGRSMFGGRAAMLAMISERRDQEALVVGYHVLRIPEDGFLYFLHRWVEWLNRTGLSDALAA